jgi:hypothetical protein
VKERDEHFNTIWPMFPTKQEWRVKERNSIPTLTASNNDMDLLDDDESLLIKDGSPLSSGIRPSSGVPRKRSLRCISASRRPCSRSLRSQANT